MSAIESRNAITEEQQRELDNAFERARTALAIIEGYDQARVDRLCQAVAWAVANKRAFTRLAEMGIAESGLGDLASRIGKRMKIRGVLRDALRERSVGIIEELPEKGIVKYGKPAGIVACVVPTTNPDLTPAGNAIYAIKARDVVIFSPHPRSAKTTFETIRLMRAALEREGAPADIVQCLITANIPMAQAVMARADLVVATGGQPMVRSAYSSGTPAYGVGAGNSTMIIDETADIEEAARNTRLSKTSDYGSGCSADGNLLIEASIFDRVIAQLRIEGGQGHSCGIYSFDQDHIHALALAAPVGRIMVRQPQSKANAGAFNNGMPMTSSLGCGTWGGNIVSENVHLKHYLNTTWVSFPTKEDRPSDEELFGVFYDASLEAEASEPVTV